MTEENNDRENPRVFVSYSWDSPEHRLWVESFAGELRRTGIDARLDAWRDENQSIDDFMMIELERADIILAICTPEFHQKIIANAEGVQGTASGFEVGTAAAMRRMAGKPIVPVLRRGQWTEAAPSNLLSYRYYDFTKEDVTEEFTQLRDHLLGHKNQAPPLGLRSGPAAAPELPDIFAGQSRPEASDQMQAAPAAADPVPPAAPRAVMATPAPVERVASAAPPGKSGKNKLLMVGGIVAALIIAFLLIPGSEDAGQDIPTTGGTQTFDTLVDECQRHSAWVWPCDVPAIAEIEPFLEGPCACQGRILRHIETGLYRCEVLPAECGGVSFIETLGYEPDMEWYEDVTPF